MYEGRGKAKRTNADFALVARYAGTPRSLRREGKRTWLEVPARQARNGFIRHLPSRFVLVARLQLVARRHEAWALPSEGGVMFEGEPAIMQYAAPL